MLNQRFELFNTVIAIFGIIAWIYWAYKYPSKKAYLVLPITILVECILFYIGDYLGWYNSTQIHTITFSIQVQLIIILGSLPVIWFWCKRK